MKRGARGALANAALAIAGMLAALGAIEVGVRLFDPQPAFLYRFSPATWYEPIPGARFTYRREEFAVPITYNSFGMRDRERSIENASGALRVALLGDSFAEAKEVPLDSTLAQTLDRLLRESVSERPVEVLNFGVSGFGTVASAIRFETLASRFRPDVTLYLFVHNDPEDNVSNDARLYTLGENSLEFREHRLGGAKRVSREIVDWSKRNLHAYRFLRFRAERLISARRAQGQGASAPGEPDAPGSLGRSESFEWRVTRLAIERLRDRVAQGGGALLVASATTTGADMTRELARTCSDLGVPFVDLAPALAADPGPVSYRFDGHWRSRGHAVAARELAPVLSAMLRERAGIRTPPAASDAPRAGAPDAAR